MLISEISKKSVSGTSSASDKKDEFRSSKSLNFTNRFYVWFFGKAICWSDAEITIVHMVQPQVLQTMRGAQLLLLSPKFILKYA